MTTPTLGSILLGGADPDRLRAWYHAALAPDPTATGSSSSAASPCSSTVAATSLPRTATPRVILNFHVDDAHATAAHLNELGVT